RKPVTGCKHDEHKREHDTNSVVSNPADRTLEGFLWRGGDTRMPKRALQQVTNPASEQTVTERWKAERMLQEQIPKIYRQSCTNTDSNRTKNIACFNAHHPSWTSLEERRARMERQHRPAPQRCLHRSMARKGFSAASAGGR